MRSETVRLRVLDHQVGIEVANSLLARLVWRLHRISGPVVGGERRIRGDTWIGTPHQRIGLACGPAYETEPAELPGLYAHDLRVAVRERIVEGSTHMAQGL